MKKIRTRKKIKQNKMLGKMKQEISAHLEAE